MKLRVCSAESAAASSGAKAQPLQPPLAALVHAPRTSATTARVAPRDRRRLQRARREQHQRVEDLLVEARGVRERVVAPLDRGREPRAQRRLPLEVPSEVAPSRRRRGAPRPAPRAGPPRAVHRVRRVVVQEPSSDRKLPFAEHREQERGEREVRLVEQRLQRRLPARRREPELVAPAAARAA